MGWKKSFRKVASVTPAAAIIKKLPVPKVASVAPVAKAVSITKKVPGSVASAVSPGFGATAIGGKFARRNPAEFLLVTAPGVGAYVHPKTRNTAIAATIAGAAVVGGGAAVAAAQAADGLSSQGKDVPLSGMGDDPITAQGRQAASGLTTGQMVAIGVGALVLGVVAVKGGLG